MKRPHSFLLKNRKVFLFFLILFIGCSAFSQKFKVSGIVTDNSNQMPMPGASIVENGTTNGTITDINGNFTLEVSNDNAVLKISFIGYKTIEIQLEGKTNINVGLDLSAEELDEIVVIGYGVTKKSDLTGSVSSIKEENFNSSAGATPEQLIQGRIAGVNIVSNNGEPGAGANITVRGASTFRSGAQPLYIIDGIPMDMQNTTPDGPSKGGIGSTATNPLNFINPNDIESIDVLKDASAAAIYGSRGANGVIIITTKKGTEGKSEVEYSANFSISQLPKKLDVLTADEWRVIRKDTLQLPFIIDDGIDELDYGSSTDWQDEIFRTATGQNHTLAMSSGSEKTSYRVSLGYLNQKGIIKNSDREKFSGRLNLNQKALNDRLQLETNLTLASENMNRPPVGAAGFEGDLVLNALKANPTWPIKDEFDNFFQSGSASERVPTTMLEYSKDLTRTTTLLGGLAATFTILEGLNLKVNYGTNYSNANRFINTSQKLEYTASSIKGLGGYGEINNKELWNYIIENTINYNKALGESKIDFVGGYSYQNFYLRGNKTLGGAYTTDAIEYTNRIQAGLASSTEISSWVDTYKMQSLFGRLNFNYIEKHLVTFTLRADGSSKFGKNNKYGYFPSAAYAWRISEENFMQNLDFISNLKLRIGWGQTGNSEIGTKNSQYIYAIDDASIAITGGTQVQGFKMIRTPNPDITWETTTSTNIGLDFGLFSGRFSGTIDVFEKKTTDILLTIPSNPGAPTATVVRNINSCDIINDGLEFGITTTPVAMTDFSWEVNASLTFLKNIVKNLPNEQYSTGRAAGQGLTDKTVQLIINNQPMNAFYGFQVDSVSADGDIFYLQTLPNATGETFDSLAFLGNPQPKLTWSLTNSFRYKAFDLSFFFEGKHGNKIFNNTNLLLEKTNVKLAQNALSAYVNDEINYDLATEVTDRYLETGSFVRLSNATLGYSPNISNTKWISRIRIYITGSNLLLFTKYAGYDPDVNSNQEKDGVRSLGVDISNYPKARTIMAGINVTF